MAIPTGPIAISCTSVSNNNGVWTIMFSDGSGIDAQSWADLVATVETGICNIDQQFVKHLALAKWIANNPTGANPNQLAGKTATLNLTLNNIMQLTNT